MQDHRPRSWFGKIHRGADERVTSRGGECRSVITFRSPVTMDCSPASRSDSSPPHGSSASSLTRELGGRDLRPLNTRPRTRENPGSPRMPVGVELPRHLPISHGSSSPMMPRSGCFTHERSVDPTCFEGEELVTNVEPGPHPARVAVVIAGMVRGAVAGEGPDDAANVQIANQYGGRGTNFMWNSLPGRAGLGGLNARLALSRLTNNWACPPQPHATMNGSERQAGPRMIHEHDLAPQQLRAARDRTANWASRDRSRHAAARPSPRAGHPRRASRHAMQLRSRG
jgi:hypothetical protein